MKGRAARRLVLDIGSSAIRLCELTQTKSGYQLSKYYQREMLIDPSVDEPTKREIRVAALRDILKEAKARSKKAIFGVPGQSVFTRTRALPPVPEHKVTQIVRYEIQQQIPFALDQIALDYQVLGRTEAGGYEVLMAAIKVDVVDKHLDLLQEVKRSVDLVDVAPLAAYNWLKHTGEFGDQGECVALLDIGAATTDIVIERDNQFRFTRSLNIGGNDITAAVARNFNVDFAEAERLKRERGFAPTGDPQRDGKGGEVIGQVLGRLVNEIARSFAYFRSQPGGGPVSRVILAGGTASLRNIVPYLQRQLGLDVRIAQPLAGLAVSANAQEANERPEQASVALGLALRNIQNVPIEINLIPPRIIESARRKEQAFYWALSIVTLALIMASTVPLRAKRTDVINRQIDILKGQLSKYDPTLAIDPTKQSSVEQQADAREKQQKQLVDQIKTLDNARLQRNFWLEYMKAVNDARPPGQGVWFSSIQTTVIGGPNNTGRPAAAGGSAPAATPAAAAPAAAPASASLDIFGRGSAAAPAGGATPARGAAAPAAPARSGLGGLGSLGAAPAAAAAGGGAASETTSAGFPGIQPAVATAPGAAAAGGGFGGGFGGAQANPEDQKSVPPTLPNGLMIHGFAESPEAVYAFVKRLKESDKFIPNGVYLDESAANTVPMTTLYNAPVDSSPSSGYSSGAAAARGNDEEGTGFGRRGGGMLNSGPATSAAPTQGQPQVPTVTTFRIDVQFAGNPVKLEEGESLTQGSAQAGAAGGGGDLFGRGNRRDRRQ
jgi:type IV pilus assembly protein PilM